MSIVTGSTRVPVRRTEATWEEVRSTFPRSVTVHKIESEMSQYAEE